MPRRKQFHMLTAEQIVANGLGYAAVVSTIKYNPDHADHIRSVAREVASLTGLDFTKFRRQRPANDNYKKKRAA